MRILVVTNCTGRKRGSGLTVADLLAAWNGSNPDRGVQELAREWLALVGGSSRPRLHANRLYMGRSFADASAVAGALGADFAVVSAGLGYVDAREMVPAYSLTVTEGEHSVLPMLATASASVQEWWAALNRARRNEPKPVARALTTRTYCRALIALPSRYLAMVAADLDAVPTEDRRLIRIFTSPTGKHSLPDEWHDFVVPYDDRLDGDASTRRGTRVDFPQRAMRHFVEDLDAVSLPLDEAKAQVERALASQAPPEVPVRRRVTDDDVLALLRANWSACSGQSSRLLRFLRDEAQVACEQSRFRALWLRARAEMAQEART